LGEIQQRPRGSFPRRHLVPARGYADLAAKLAFARDDRQIRAWEPAAAVFTGLYKDVQRLAKTTLPGTADEELLDRVSECEEAMTVHRALSERYDREREEAERAADAAGYHEAKGYSPGEAWRIRSDYIDQIRARGSYDRWNAAHKEIGRTARAVFAIKAKTLRGAIAKLRLVVKLIEADELDTWQGDRDWLAETLADLERIAAAK
jgi:hypothetical protein